MWILVEGEDPTGGARKWLKPGTQVVLGRATGSKEKQISRRQIVIQIGSVNKNEGLSIRHRSIITLAEVKKGSFVDGEEVTETEKTLEPKNLHTIRFGSSNFTITWVPQVLTIPAKQKNSKNALRKWLDKVEAFDVKCIPEFLPGVTTAVVAIKRNLPLGLRSLVNGGYIVTDDYLDAIAKACTRTNGDQISAPLEDDFDQNWPDPIQFLPPPASEPVPRDPEFFRPDSKRKTMFEKWTVVTFSTQHQDAFMGAVTDGGGKFELFELVPGKTKPNELFVHLDKLGRFIVVQPNSADEWHTTFVQEVVSRTRVAFAQQNEFLDAIITADPKALCIPLDGDVGVPESIILPTTKPSPDAPKTKQNTEETSEANGAGSFKAGNKRSQSSLTSRVSRTYVSQINKDDSDDDFVPLPPPSSTTTSFRPASQPSKSVSFSQAQGGRGTQLAVIQESQGRKRTMSPSDDEDEQENLDKMLPGQAAMKRRKIEIDARESRQPKPQKNLPSFKEEEVEEAEESEVEVKEENEVKATRGRKKIIPEQSRVIQAAQAIRRKEDAVAALEQAGEEMTSEEITAVSKMRDLAIVELFEIQPRTDRLVSRSQAYGDESSRWDPMWNGRKNFKKFKKRTKDGESGATRRMAGPIVVQLVEHKAPDHGIGETYWLEGSAASGRKRNTSSNNLTHVSETQILLDPPRNLGQILEIDDSEDEIEELETNRDEPSVRKSQATSQPTQSGRTTTRSSGRTHVSSTQPFNSTSRSKRTTQGTSDSGPARKKQKTNSMFLSNDSEDDSEDELKFKFK